MAKVTINGQVVKVKSGTSILNAANSIGIEIPTLCFIKEINEIGFCRICVVEVEGEQDLVSACNTEIKNGMVINTDSDKVIQSRESTLQLLASKHRFDCWRCPKDGMCEFYDILKFHNIVFEEFGPGVGRNPEQIFGTAVSQDQSKCILCKRCVAVCQNVAAANVLKFRDDDGMNPVVSPTVGLSFDQGGCTFCGQCVKSCPTGTLFETDHIKEVEALIKDENKTVVVQMDPAVRVSLAEEFGYEIGSLVEETEGKIYEALNLLGFDEITNTTWAEDLVILEQSNELADKLNNGEELPLFTSSCPAWIRYAEMFNPEYLDNISKTKSPHMIQGSLIKNHYGPKYLNKKPLDIAVVSVMPCTAKKYEISRPELEVDGVRDVDAVLTIRELAKMIKRKGIKFNKLNGIELDGAFKDLASTKPVATEGVLKATLDALSNKLENKAVSPFELKYIYGGADDLSKGTIKEATVTVNGKKLNVAVVHGGAAIKEMLKLLKTGKKEYHFIEVMSCPGACANGGGQPLSKDLPMHDVIRRRAEVLTNQQTDLEPTKSYDNDLVKKVYNEFLRETNSDVAQKYLHTVYSMKEFTRE